MTEAVPSLSAWNVWDLPWSYWLSYAAWIDQVQQKRREASGG